MTRSIRWLTAPVTAPRWAALAIAILGGLMLLNWALGGLLWVLTR